MRLGEPLPGPPHGVLIPDSTGRSRTSLMMRSASSNAAGTWASTSLLACGWRFFAEFTDNGNQTVDLRLVQAPSEGRHVSFALINLREDFGVGQLLGFGGAKIFRSDGFADYRTSASIRAVALGAVRVVKFLTVRLRCREMRERRAGTTGGVLGRQLCISL